MISSRPQIRMLTLERCVIVILLMFMFYLRSATTKLTVVSQTNESTEPFIDSAHPIESRTAPAAKATPAERPFNICDNAVTRSIPREELENGINKRLKFYEEALPRLKSMLNAEKLRDGPLDPCRDIHCHSALKHGWSGLRHNHDRWSLMGDVAVKCPTMKSFGHGDEEKRFCFPKELSTQENCVVFSIGSNNQWDFESDIAHKTKCKIHTFDCTVNGNVPWSLKDRITFHNACLGSSQKHGEKYHDLAGLMSLANVTTITFLKMDIEGFEWDVLEDIIASATQVLETTGKDIFPNQIAVEVHYLTLFQEIDWRGRDLSPAEIYLYFEKFFRDGGYVLAERRDNIFCNHCSEVLLEGLECL